VNYENEEKKKKKGKSGKVVDVIGDVVDVKFEDNMKKILNDMEVKKRKKRIVLEVEKNMGEKNVRKIEMDGNEGLVRGKEVLD
jgi:F-type H+-transporting ATPase subunit beta